MNLTVRIERWPLQRAFTISRGSKTEAVVVVAELECGGHRGRGEAVPYLRYGETPEGVAAAIEAMATALRDGLNRHELQAAMPSGAARNALDCAFWDLEAKRAGRPAYDFAALPAPKPVVTAYTVSLDTPNAMADAAVRAKSRPLLKVKLGGGSGDAERIAVVRRAAPEAELIVDANEGWSEADLERNLAACAQAGVTLIEQPLPQGRDAALRQIRRPIPVCADESVHDRASLDAISGKYDAINVKLDKAGGLTEALALAAEAERRGLDIMVGCMVATSLAMAPAMLVAQRARVADLDGPLLLAEDRPHGLRYDGSVVYPAEPILWG
jgi:L-alanine-DL-glutamate epimerase-like enolase superfamily enzyme